LATQHGVTVVDCNSGEDLEQAAHRAVQSRVEMVFAAGGDGTISTVAAILAGTPVALGVLPVGTLNHFAKDLGIPLEIDAAMHLVSTGRVIGVDVARVNDRIFINNSGLGLYPYMVRHREAVQRRGWAKWFAALVASIKALARYRLLRLHIAVDGVRIARRTPAVFVGNNEYRLDVAVEPRRLTLHDGKLCLYIPRVQRRIELMLFSLRALFGSRHEDSALDMFLTDRFTIDSRHRHLRVSLDGETQVMTTPLEYSAWPGSLRVLVPAEPTTTR
jgi:diacylglycerol kinase family enzyme